MCVHSTFLFLFFYSESVDEKEFRKGVKKLKLDLSEDDIALILEIFDEDGR